jgi:hypothetical protein
LAGSELAVLRKLGQRHTPETPFPSHWSRSGGIDEPRNRNVLQRSGTNVNGVADMAHSATANGPPPEAAATRQQHLARMRAGELEARVAELGARLIDAEQRAAELLRTRARLRDAELELERAHAEVDELRGQLAESEAARQQAEHWLACINWVQVV